MLAWFFSFIAFIISFIPQPTFREGVVGQPRSLNPLEFTTNQPDRDLARFVHRGVMRYDENGTLTTDLAESYEISGDGRQYTFKLKRGVNWHDGKNFNADDVIETIAQQHQQVVEIDKLDDDTVRLKLIKETYAPLLDLLTQPVVPASYKGGSTKGLWGVGLGDYRVARIKKGAKVESLYLTPAWPWKKSQNNFSRIIFNFYDNPEQLLTAAKLAEVDAFGTDVKLPKPNIFELTSLPLGSRYYALFFNLENEYLKDRAIRLALKSRIALNKIIQENLRDSVSISYQPLEYTFPTPQLATASGQPKLPLKKKPEKPLVITIPDSDLDVGGNLGNLQKLANEIKNSWQEAGITTEITKVPLDSIFKDVVAKKDFQVLLFGQEVERDPDVYTLWHSAQINLPGLNFSSFKNALADKSLEDGRKRSTEEQRAVFYQRFLKVFNDETPAVFLYHPIYNYYYKKNIIGPNLNGFYKISDRFVNFRSWKHIKF